MDTAQRTIDLGTATLYIDEGQVDLHFPKEHGELKELVKGRFKGRWNPDRRCWTVVSRFARASVEEVAGEVERTLYANAPGKWPDAVRRFGPFACATKRYEVVFRAGGIRLTFPPGHPCHYDLKQLQGASCRGETWLIPARHAIPSKVMPAVERAAREDKAAFVEAVEPYEGRTLKGSAALTPREADEAGFRPGRVAFAEYSFVKAADPQVVNMPVHYWAFLVREREDVHDPETGSDHVVLKIEYLPAAHGCAAVRKLMAMPDAERPRRLDAPHVAGKWVARQA